MPTPNPEYEHFKNFSGNGMSFPERKKVWLEISDMTEDEFDRMLEVEKAQQDNVPPVGAEAPDFELEVLTRDRKRTGEYVKLSDYRGKPLGIVFGSFT